jgi:hypothetical protein
MIDEAASQLAGLKRAELDPVAAEICPGEKFKKIGDVIAGIKGAILSRKGLHERAQMTQ